jgi:hypothetical protein
MLKLEYVIQKRIISFDANFVNVFFELIVNYERVPKNFFLLKIDFLNFIFHFSTVWNKMIYI